MKSFMYRFPGEPYAYGPLTAENYQDAREKVRKRWGVGRLPKGFEIWESDGRW